MRIVAVVGHVGLVLARAAAAAGDVRNAQRDQVAAGLGKGVGAAAGVVVAVTVVGEVHVVGGQERLQSPDGGVVAVGAGGIVGIVPADDLPGLGGGGEVGHDPVVLLAAGGERGVGVDEGDVDRAVIHRPVQVVIGGGGCGLEGLGRIREGEVLREVGGVAA